VKKIIQIILCTFPLVAFATTTDELIHVHTLTTAQRNALVSPVDGVLAFDSDIKKLYVHSNGKWEELLFSAIVVAKTGDYTLTQSDNGKIFTFDSSAAVTLTIPSGLTIGYNVSVYQINIGKVAIVGSGTTVLNRLSRFKTAGKDAGIGIVSTASDIFHITGDLKR